MREPLLKGRPGSRASWNRKIEEPRRASGEVFCSTNPPPRSGGGANAAHSGGSIRPIFQVPHAAKKPLSTWHITEQLMKERGLPLDDAKLFRTMQQRIRVCLNRYRRTMGVLESLHGPDGVVLWKLAQDQSHLSRSNGSTPKSFANVSTTSSVGLRLPRSIWPT